MTQVLRRLPINTELVAFTLLILFLALYPMFGSRFGILNVSYFMSLLFLSISVALIWGFAGILSFGQTAFFGLAAYTFAVYTTNNPGGWHSWIGALIAIIAAALLAALLGYIMFYGGVNDVFVGLTMLAVTLVMATFMGQTAGPEWTIGVARLNGFNGMFVNPISWPGGEWFTDQQVFYFFLTLLFAVYIILKIVTSSRWGYGLIALRENRSRTETFGYNVQLMQVQVFAISGAIAGLSGVLYASWGGYIDPSSMGMTAAITPVIYVAIGGRKSLTAAIVGSLALMKLIQELSSTAPEYAFVITGAVALLAVLYVPEGIVYTLFKWCDDTLFKNWFLSGKTNSTPATSASHQGGEHV